jgi:hypothetical protein
VVEQDYCDRGLHSMVAVRARIKHLKSVLGQIRAADLSTDQVKAYQRSRLKVGVSKSTVNREIETLSRAWHMGMQHDPPKVTRPFHFPSYDESDNVRTGFLEYDQY